MVAVVEALNGGKETENWKRGKRKEKRYIGIHYVCLFCRKRREGGGGKIHLPKLRFGHLE